MSDYLSINPHCPLIAPLPCLACRELRHSWKSWNDGILWQPWLQRLRCQSQEGREITTTRNVDFPTQENSRKYYWKLSWGKWPTSTYLVTFQERKINISDGEHAHTTGLHKSRVYTSLNSFCDNVLMITSKLSRMSGSLPSNMVYAFGTGIA